MIHSMFILIQKYSSTPCKKCNKSICGGKEALNP